MKIALSKVLIYKIRSGAKVILSLSLTSWVCMDAFSAMHIDPTGQTISMTSDMYYTGYEEDKVLDIRLNDIELDNKAISKIATMRNLKAIRLGDFPEGVKFTCNNLGELANLKQLEFLHISTKSIKGQQAYFIEKLVKLKEFYLAVEHDDDETNSVIARSLSQLKSLSNLAISCPRFKDEHLILISKGCDLHEVELLSTLTSNLSIRYLVNEPSLIRLQVKSPLISDRAAELIAENKNLMKICISSPIITAQFIFPLRKLKSLKELRISLQHGDLDTFKSMRQLEQLEVMEVSCKDSEKFDISPLAGHPSLKRLLVRGILITKEAKQIVEGLPRIEYCQFSDWNFDVNGLPVK